MKVVLLDQMKNSAEKPKMVILQSRLLLRKSSEHLPPATTTTALTTGPRDMSKLLKMRYKNLMETCHFEGPKKNATTFVCVFSRRFRRKSRLLQWLVFFRQFNANVHFLCIKAINAHLPIFTICT